MREALARVLEEEPRIAYAVLFGSATRESQRPDSDVDVAIETTEPLEPLELGDLIGRLESAAGRTVDLVLLDEAPIALAYRIFRDGVVLFERDHAALVRRKARAILEYLDFEPIERLCVRGVLAAARHGR